MRGFFKRNNHRKLGNMLQKIWVVRPATFAEYCIFIHQLRGVALK